MEAQQQSQAPEERQLSSAQPLLAAAAQQQQEAVQPGAASAAAEAPTAAGRLNLSPGAFVDDLHNAVHFYCKEGFDALEAGLRQQHPALSPDELTAYREGAAALELGVRREVDAQLQKFEAYALETCLHVPAGLLADAQAAGGEGEAAVDEAEEAAAEAELTQLRGAIAAAKHEGRKLKTDIAAYDAALQQHSGTLAALQAIPGTLAGKENAVAEDSRALAAAGLALEASCAQLDNLCRQKAAAERTSGGTGQRDELAAEKEVLRRQAAVRAAPADDLRRLQERLAS